MKTKMTSTAKLSLILLEFRTLMKMYHWTTTTYSRHVASCGFIASLDSAIDSIIETYSARHGRPALSGSMNLTVFTMTDAEAFAGLERFATFLLNEMPKYLGPQDTDILNKRDDLLGLVHQTMYLFTFK